MNSYIICLILIIAQLAVACENNNLPFTDTPIIESYLSPGKYPVVKISRQIPFSSEAVCSKDDINSLAINITSDNITHALKAYGEGIYADSSFKVTEGNEYVLSFVYNSKNVSAVTVVPPKPLNFSQSATSISVMQMDGTNFSQMGSFDMPEPVSLTWDNDDGSYFIVVIENMETKPVAVRDFGESGPPGNMFRKRPTNSQGIELRPQEFQYFGKHRIILNHVLPDYASLYDDNISSSQNLTNPSTSIINGYGIFTGLNSDTLFIKVYQAAR
jgi:hypothetical protein